MKVARTFNVEQRGIGNPDYAAPIPVGQYPVGPVHTLTNMAEAAVRLGSIVTFDRRGDVIWFDDFESGTVNKWEAMVHASPGEVIASAERARNGTFSAKFIGAALAPTLAGIAHYERFPVVGFIGVEVSFTLETDITYVALYSDLFDGTNSRLFEMRYNLATQELEYLDNLGVWVTLATGLNVYGYISLYHTIKFIVDLNTNQYIRCILDNVSYPMTNIAGQVTLDAATVPCWRVSLLQHCEITPDIESFMDDVILTQNEPERSPT